MKVLNPGKLKRLNVPRREEKKNSTLPKTMPQAAGKKLIISWLKVVHNPIVKEICRKKIQALGDFLATAQIYTEIGVSDLILFQNRQCAGPTKSPKGRESLLPWMLLTMKGKRRGDQSRYVLAHHHKWKG